DTNPARGGPSFSPTVTASHILTLARSGALNVNYLLFVGLALFSSACGALLVTLLRLTPRDRLRAPSQQGTDPGIEKESGT
ncbi:MAG: hypothetical protein WB918_18970, partial [Candidatus Sulfotelmatobacter sp.]